MAQNANDPFGFITGLVAAFNAAPNDSSHPFLQLSPDESSPQGQLELSPTLGGTPVFNYAVAKIRYRGNVPADNVSVSSRTCIGLKKNRCTSEMKRVARLLTKE